MDRPSTIAELVDENEELRQANARLREELAEARTVRPEARAAMERLSQHVPVRNDVQADLATVLRELGMEE